MRIECRHCGSRHLVRFGKREVLIGVQQLWRCADCGRTTSERLFRYMRVTDETVVLGVRLYRAGYSLREICDFFKVYGVRVRPLSVWGWVRKHSSGRRDINAFKRLQGVRMLRIAKKIRQRARERADQGPFLNMLICRRCGHKQFTNRHAGQVRCSVCHRLIDVRESLYIDRRVRVG